jgi:hypothetical protein
MVYVQDVMQYDSLCFNPPGPAICVFLRVRVLIMCTYV